MMPPMESFPTDELPMMARVVLALQQLAAAVTANTTLTADAVETVREMAHALTRDADSRDAWRVWLTTSLEGRAALIFALTSLFGPGFLEVVQMIRGPL